ncbi:hypothetical protein BT63DRAFT_409355 [Microthyrium microscopicum]|uniref:Uncharacterized protein n=1 Tax=Microthyrium microscopicum TaxID=703497 RepID=A0A6A6UWA3_9PEZI|nr:hypothetical protein BT63DRAFT_409355 [Microthyrium microscopicum]
MKLELISWLFGAAALVSASSSGQVLLLESPHQPATTSADTVSPKIARLIFAQRLGLSDDFSISGFEPAEIQQVDRYGGPQQHPMAGAPPKGSRVLIVVDGVEKSEDIFQHSQSTTSFEIIPAPHPEDTRELLSEFADHDSSKASNYHSNLRALNDLSEHVGNDLQIHGDKIILHLSSLTRLSQTYGLSSHQYKDEVIKVQHLIDELHAHDDFTTVTIAFMPPEAHCGKRAGAAKSYGGSQRRAVQLKARSEVPLHPDTKSNAKAESFSPATNQLTAAKSSIPARYTSQQGCERTTSNCTGHGECKVVATEKEDDRDIQYFSCVCNKPEVREFKDGGKKTTYFGGTACQKKDVAAPFWLLAGTSVMLVSVVTLGIGLLYSMGSEELPSVIGAGVSGPRAK